MTWFSMRFTIIYLCSMIEITVNDRLGKKVRVKCNEDDTIGDLKVSSRGVQGTVNRCPTGNFNWCRWTRLLIFWGQKASDSFLLVWINLAQTKMYWCELVGKICIDVCFCLATNIWCFRVVVPENYLFPPI